MTPWTVNTVPKLFRMLPLPQERLLHNWYRENESEFEALFDHVQQETENETKRLLAMRKKGRSMCFALLRLLSDISSHTLSYTPLAHTLSYIYSLSHPLTYILSLSHSLTPSDAVTTPSHTLSHTYCHSLTPSDAYTTPSHTL